MTDLGRATIAELPTIAELHRAVDKRTRRLEVLHADALQCRRGCHECCVDDITVFEVEAERIMTAHAQMLRTEHPHAPGACAFLDGEGACRVYESRPYVCRTQGLPLRWIDEHNGEPAEFRDICRLNDEGLDLTSLSAEECWEIGPSEAALQQLQSGKTNELKRVSLRSLFGLATTPPPSFTHDDEPS